MSDSRQQPKVPRQPVSDDRTSANSSPQVEFGTDGSVHVTYMSRASYDRDQQLLKAAKMGEKQDEGASNIDRLSSLPTETQVEIVKYLIPNRGRIAVGYDYYGPNTSGIRPGSLSILRVSKHLSEIALRVLYGYRWFRISASCAYSYPPDVLMSMGTIQLISATRWDVLRCNTDQAHSIHSPLNCFTLLVYHTPAKSYLTRLEIMINNSLGESLINGRLLRALQYAKELRLLELFMGMGTPDIIPFVHELGHIHTIKAFSWSGKDVLYETQLAKRNREWVRPPKAAESI